MSTTVTAAALTAVGMLALAACHNASGQPGPVRAPTGFGWFSAQPVPHGWHTADLPDGTGTLAYPPTARRMHADVDAVAAGTTAGGTVVTYYNATPQQGAETPANWASFRVDHLTDDDARSATLDTAATGLAFRGGSGSCVLDHYTTRIGAHDYHEIACLVTGAHGSSVLVVAATAADWARKQATLEQAVASYAAR